MIYDRNDIVDKFNDRFDKIDKVYASRAMAMGLPLYKVPAVCSNDDRFKPVTAFFGGTDTLILTANSGTNILQRALAQSLIPPYSMKFSTTVGVLNQVFFVGIGGLTGVYYSPSNVDSYDDKVVAYSESGIRIANGTSGNFVPSTLISSPRLISNNDYVGSKVRTFGFRELAYGQLELYDDKTDSWYSVNNTHMGSSSRHIYARLGSTRTYNFTIVL